MDSKKGLGRKLFLALFLFALLFLIFFRFSEITKITSAIQQVKWHILFLALVMQIGTYFFMTLIYDFILKLMGKKSSFSKLFKLSLATTFINQVLPSGGLAGIGLTTQALEKEDITKPQSTLVSFIFYGFNYLAFIIILFLGTIFLLIRHNLAPHQLAIAIVITVIVVFALFLFYSFLKRHTVVSRFSTPIIKLIDRIFRWLKKEPVAPRLNAFFEALQEDFNILFSDKRKLVLPLFYAVVFHLFDLATIFVIFYGFGYTIDWGILSVGYVFANLISMVSLIPFGLGVFEFSLAASFANFAVPFSVAFLVTLVYRGLAFWLPIPIGWFFMRNLVADKKE